jgi:uncharacterized protein (DUF2236 family)
VTPAARVLCRQLLYLPAPAPVRLIQPLGEQITIAFLPPRLRELYGYTWGPARQRLFTAATTVMRQALPLVPPALRYTPWARRAMARARDERQLPAG